MVEVNLLPGRPFPVTDVSVCEEVGGKRMNYTYKYDTKSIKCPGIAESCGFTAPATKKKRLQINESIIIEAQTPKVKVQSRLHL